MLALAFTSANVLAAGDVSPQAASGAKPGRPATTAATDPWQQLTPVQKQFLQPLEREWARLDPQQRRKWSMLSTRAPAMSADERQRIQARMTEWATLTPEQRGQARQRFQEARTLPARDRQARWDAYQSLPPEEKKQLAARAGLPPVAPSRASDAGSRPERRSGLEPAAKSNIVPNPALAAPPRSIGPATLQARPGATTTLITKRATPPSHQQTGMPKIAATPEFVDQATLLPQRGPQSTRAARPAPAPASAQTPSTAPASASASGPDAALPR